MPRAHRTPALTLVALILASLIPIAAAHAQRVTVSRGFSAGANAQRVTSADIDAMKDILALDQSQKALLDDLFAAYTADAGAAHTEIQRIEEAIQKEIERTSDFSIWREASPKFDSYRRYLDRLRTRMIDDLKLVLTEDQLPRFDRFERHQRRASRLASNFPPVHGAGVDLILVADRLDLTDEQRAAIAPTLERYELELDRFFLENDPEAIARQAMGDVDEGQVMRQMEDPAEMAKLMARASAMMNDMRRLSLAVRDINERTLRQLVAALPEGLGPALELEFRRAAFPEVYADTEAQAIIRTVQAMNDLTPDQRERITLLAAEHAAELDRLRNAMVAALRAEDSKDQQGMFGGMRIAFAQDNELIQRITSDRAALDARSIELARAMLTPIQAQRLPGAEILDWRSMGNFDDR